MKRISGARDIHSRLSQISLVIWFSRRSLLDLPSLLQDAARLGLSRRGLQLNMRGLF